MKKQKQSSSKPFEVLFYNYSAANYPELAKLETSLVQNDSNVKIINKPIEQFYSTVPISDFDDPYRVIVLFTRKVSIPDSVKSKLKLASRNRTRILIYPEAQGTTMELATNKDELVTLILDAKNSSSRRSKSIKMISAGKFLGKDRVNNIYKAVNIRVLNSKNDEFNSSMTKIITRFEKNAAFQFKGIKDLKQITDILHQKPILIVCQEDAPRILSQLKEVKSRIPRLYTILFDPSGKVTLIQNEFNLNASDIHIITDYLTKYSGVTKVSQTTEPNNQYYNTNQKKNNEPVMKLDPNPKSQSPGYRIRLESAKKYSTKKFQSPNSKDNMFSENHFFVFELPRNQKFMKFVKSRIVDPKLISTLPERPKAKTLILADYDSRMFLMQHLKTMAINNISVIFYVVTQFKPDPTIKSSNVQLVSNRQQEIQNYLNSQYIRLIPKIPDNKYEIKITKQAQQLNNLNEYEQVPYKRVVSQNLPESPKPQNQKSHTFFEMNAKGVKNDSDKSISYRWIVKKKPASNKFVTFQPENQQYQLRPSIIDPKKSSGSRVFKKEVVQIPVPSGEDLFFSSPSNIKKNAEIKKDEVNTEFLQIKSKKSQLAVKTAGQKLETVQNINLKQSMQNRPIYSKQFSIQRKTPDALPIQDEFVEKQAYFANWYVVKIPGNIGFQTMTQKNYAAKKLQAEIQLRRQSSVSSEYVRKKLEEEQESNYEELRKIDEVETPREVKLIGHVELQNICDHQWIVKKKPKSNQFTTNQFNVNIKDQPSDAIINVNTKNQAINTIIKKQIQITESKYNPGHPLFKLPKPPQLEQDKTIMQTSKENKQNIPPLKTMEWHVYKSNQENKFNTVTDEQYTQRQLATPALVTNVLLNMSTDIFNMPKKKKAQPTGYVQNVLLQSMNYQKMKSSMGISGGFNLRNLLSMSTTPKIEKNQYKTEKASGFKIENQIKQANQIIEPPKNQKPQMLQQSIELDIKKFKQQNRLKNESKKEQIQQMLVSSENIGQMLQIQGNKLANPEVHLTSSRDVFSDKNLAETPQHTSSILSRLNHNAPQLKTISEKQGVLEEEKKEDKIQQKPKSKNFIEIIEPMHEEQVSVNTFYHVDSPRKQPNGEQQGLQLQKKHSYYTFEEQQKLEQEEKNDKFPDTNVGFPDIKIEPDPQIHTFENIKRPIPKMFKNNLSIKEVISNGNLEQPISEEVEAQNLVSLIVDTKPVITNQTLGRQESVQTPQFASNQPNTFMTETSNNYIVSFKTANQQSKSNFFKNTTVQSDPTTSELANFNPNATKILSDLTEKKIADQVYGYQNAHQSQMTQKPNYIDTRPIYSNRQNIVTYQNSPNYQSYQTYQYINEPTSVTGLDQQPTARILPKQSIGARYFSKQSSGIESIKNPRNNDVNIYQYQNSTQMGQVNSYQFGSSMHSRIDNVVQVSDKIIQDSSRINSSGNTVQNSVSFSLTQSLPFQVLFLVPSQFKSLKNNIEAICDSNRKLVTYDNVNQLKTNEFDKYNLVYIFEDQNQRFIVSPEDTNVYTVVFSPLASEATINGKKVIIRNAADLISVSNQMAQRKRIVSNKIPVQLVLKKFNELLQTVSQQFTDKDYKMEKYYTTNELVSVSKKLDRQSIIVLITDEIPENVDIFRDYPHFTCVVIPSGKYKAYQNKYPKFKWIVEEEKSKVPQIVKQFIQSYKVTAFTNQKSVLTYKNNQYLNYNILVKETLKSEIKFEPIIPVTYVKFFNMANVRALMLNSQTNVFLIDQEFLQQILSLSNQTDKILLLTKQKEDKRHLSPKIVASNKNYKELVLALGILISDNVSVRKDKPKVFYYHEQTQLEKNAESKMPRFTFIKYTQYNNLVKKLIEWSYDTVIVIVNQALIAHINDLKTLKRVGAMRIIIYERFYKMQATYSEIPIARNIFQLIGELQKIGSN